MFTTIETSSGYILQVSQVEDKCRIEVYYLDKDREDIKHSFGYFDLDYIEAFDFASALEFHSERIVDEDLED